VENVRLLIFFLIKSRNDVFRSRSIEERV